MVEPAPDIPRSEPAAALRHALERCEDGVTVLDLDGTIVYVNPAGAAMADRPVSDAVGRNIWAEFPDVVGGPFHDAVQTAVRTGGPVRWRWHHGPLHGWYTDVAERVGDHVVIVFSRVDEPREGERARQRLTAQVQAALARSELLLAASERFTAAADIDDVHAGLAQLTGSALQPDSIGLYLRDPADPDTLLRLRADEIDEEPRRRYERVPLTADLPVAACVRTGRSVFHGDVEELAAEHPQLHADLRRIGTRAIAAVPVPGADRTLGAVVLMWRAQRDLDVSDRAVLVTFATYVGAAVARIRATEQRIAAVERRYEQTRATVVTMQRSLLPALPVLPDLDVVAHYAPAEAELAAGGDWYDALRLPDGRVALVVGDVVGHGPTAAAAMGRLRAVLEHLLLAGHDPLDALARLDDAARRGTTTRAATVALAVLDPDGALRWASCGHPPPVLVGPDGRAHVLPGPTGRPLGTGGPPDPRFGSTTRVEVGATLLLCTDGLLERPGQDPLAGLDAVVAAIGRGPSTALRSGARSVADLQRGCADLVAELGAGSDDDITVLAAHRRPSRSPLLRTVEARPSVLRGLRGDVTAWADDLRLSDDDRLFVELTVIEAVTNAVEHAYRGAPGGTVRVTVDLAGDGTCCVAVEDSGSWRAPDPQPGTRGRGLQMIRTLADDVEVRATDRGTSVVARRRVQRDAVHAEDRDAGGATGSGAATAASRGPGYGAETVRGAVAGLALSGVLDMTVEDRLRNDLLHAARGGAVPLVVDLDAVALLASAAVRVLHETVVPLGARLRASPGTPARAVLGLAGLAAHLDDGPVGSASGTA